MIQIENGIERIYMQNQLKLLATGNNARVHNGIIYTTYEELQANPLETTDQTILTGTIETDTLFENTGKTRSPIDFFDILSTNQTIRHLAKDKPLSLVEQISILIPHVQKNLQMIEQSQAYFRLACTPWKLTINPSLVVIHQMNPTGYFDMSKLHVCVRRLQEINFELYADIQYHQEENIKATDGAKIMAQYRLPPANTKENTQSEPITPNPELDLIAQWETTQDLQDPRTRKNYVQARCVEAAKNISRAIRTIPVQARPYIPVIPAHIDATTAQVVQRNGRTFIQVYGLAAPLINNYSSRSN